MASIINEIYVNGSLYPKTNELGFSVMIGEIRRYFNQATNEYIYRQMLEVNVDPKAIVFHQQRITKLEAENEKLRQEIEKFKGILAEITKLSEGR